MCGLGCVWIPCTGSTALIAAGVDLFVRNHEGECLLHLVAEVASRHHRTGHEEKLVESFTYLMELGLDPLLED
ncbi:hypothetical protein ASPZODRAFT_131667, partial [Penicilliopsis zonata CBS 506.65]